MTGEHALGAIVDVFLLLGVLFLLGGIVLGAGVIATAVAAFFSSGAKRIALIAVASLGVVAILWGVFGISSGRKKQQTKGYTSLMKAVHKKDVKKVKKLLKKVLTRTKREQGFRLSSLPAINFLMIFMESTNLLMKLSFCSLKQTQTQT